MKQIFGSLALLLLVVDCTNINSGKTEVNEKLGGEWKIEGMYKDQKRVDDTLYTEYPNKGNERDFEIFGISTDSGTYRHVYNKETGQLIKIEPSKEVDIIEFVFSTDHTGKLLQHQSPGFDQKFEVLESDSSLNLIFYNLDQTIDTTKVVKLDSQNLEILWTEGYVEKYTRTVPSKMSR